MAQEEKPQSPKIQVQTFRNGEGFTHKDMDTVNITYGTLEITIENETVVIKKPVPFTASRYSDIYGVDTTSDLLTETLEIRYRTLIRTIKI